MFEQKTFAFKVVIILGFFYVFYMFFALAQSVYRHYKFEQQVQGIAQEVQELRELDAQKPDDIAYFQSPQFKTLYAKESLGLYELGEEILSLTPSSQLIEQGEADLLTDTVSPSSVLNQPYPVQWREYFFGKTLSLR